MTYKEIINRFRTITENHLMLEDFGYGDLSDLKYVSQLGNDEKRVSYPYLYLLPSSSTRNGPVMEYSFNMIVMDMARPEDGPDTDQYDNYITIQSQSQQYIDDVLAQLYYFYKDQPEVELTGITYTPFKEKYQDVVCGMTATITIAVPTPLNECIAPFNNWVLAEDLGISLGLRPYNTDSFGNRKVCEPYQVPEAPALYKIELDVDFRVLYDLAEPTAPSPYNIPKLVIMQDADSPRFIRELPFDGTTRDPQKVKTTFVIELEDVAPDNNDLFFSWGYSTANPYDGSSPQVYPIENTDSIEVITGNVSIYKLG